MRNIIIYIKECIIKFIKAFVKFLDEITFFLPDVFLVLAILSLFKDFGEYDLIISAMLFITYLGVSYGEYMYFKHKALKELGDEIIDAKLRKFAKQINDKEFVTLNGLLMYADVLEEEIDDKFEELRYELKGVAFDEMDTEESCKEI